MSLDKDSVEKEKYREILGLDKSHISRIDISSSPLTDEFTTNSQFVRIEFVPSVDSPPLELFAKKFIPDNEEAQAVRRMQLFEKEAFFFNDLLPDLKTFCMGKSGTHDFLTDILPKCYYADEDLILLENMSVKGFVMLNQELFRQVYVGHTFEQARKVMEILAVFHSVTYTYIQSMGLEKFIQKYSLTRETCRWTPKGKESHAPWINKVIDGAIRILKKYPILGSEPLLNYLTEELGSQAFEKLGRHFNLNDAKGKSRCGVALNHGDAWNCNYLFLQGQDEEKAGSPKKVVMVDYQTIHVGSLVLDLQYYMYLATKGTVRHEMWQDLLRVYYDNFSFHVENLGGQLSFGFNDLVNDYRDHCELGFLLALDQFYFFDHVGEEDTVDKIMDTPDGLLYAKIIVKEFADYQKLVRERD